MCPQIAEELLTAIFFGRIAAVPAQYLKNFIERREVARASDCVPATLRGRPAQPAAFFIGDHMNLEKLERRALSIGEAAATSNLSRATIYRLIKDGRLATAKIGARRLVPLANLDALLAGGASK